MRVAVHAEVVDHLNRTKVLLKGSTSSLYRAEGRQRRVFVFSAAADGPSSRPFSSRVLDKAARQFAGRRAPAKRIAQVRARRLHESRRPCRSFELN